jgi:hypothetical protein
MKVTSVVTPLPSHAHTMPADSEDRLLAAEQSCFIGITS